MKTSTRRHFIRNAVAAGAALNSAPFIVTGAAQQAKAGKKYRTALIGAGWWGMNILREGMASGRCKVVALCDVDRDSAEISAEEVTDLSGDNPKTYGDFRELLDKEKPEIVIIATPDHWHALITIGAVESGAHVFVEKPTGHTVRESRAMVNAARATGRVVQVGLHRHVGPHYVSGMEFLKSGKAGTIGMVRLFVGGGRGDAEVPGPNSDPPPGMDWDMYCGPSPLRPFNRKIHPGGWRNFLDFGNGQIGDWGPHWFDQLLWWSEEKYPKRVFSTAGRPVMGEPVFNDKEQTSDAPDHQIAVFEFEGFTATWEHRRFSQGAVENHRIGCYFYGTNGIFHLGWRDGWTFYPADSKQQVVHEDPRFDHEKDGHNLPPLWTDFLNAIETGSKPAADIETGHLASTMGLLGMVSWKAGRSLEWDGERETIIGDEGANQLLSRPYREPWAYPEV